jgi:hypothetical protein
MLRFKCHYGFKSVYCNPASGNEKGSVENAVGYVRRNLLFLFRRLITLKSTTKSF